MRKLLLGFLILALIVGCECSDENGGKFGGGGAAGSW